MSKIITAEEMAAHYAPLLDLHGALKEVERLSAENERLRETLMLCAKHVDWMPHPHCVEVEAAIRAALGETE